MKIKTTGREPVISGPFTLYNGSVVFEFLQPDASCNASVLIRSTYKANHPLCRDGKAHPLTPPLHLHFDQSESFQILQGSVGTTQGWEAKDQIWTAKDGVVEIPPWRPHTFWAAMDGSEDCIMLVWAHPDKTPNAMDHVFFQNLFLYTSDLHEKKVSVDPLQLMLMQYESASTLVWFPRATFLGPLRWLVPYAMLTAAAKIATLRGYKATLEKYSTSKSN